MGNCLNFKRTSEPKPEKPTTDNAKSTDDSTFAADILKQQNMYRRRHGVPEMTMNNDMCKEAQGYVQGLAKSNALKHSETSDGENLAMASGDLTGEKAADMWYNEINDYSFSNPGFAMNTGHFTQVVWKASVEFGCGMAKSSNGGTYVVGRYRPAGNVNMRERFEENVLPAK